MNTLSEEQTDFITEAQNFDEIARCTTGFILYVDICGVLATMSTTNRPACIEMTRC